MRYLNNITLVAVATQYVEETVQAIEYSLKNLSYQSVKLISHYNPKPQSKDYEFIQVSPFKNVGEWGKYVVYELYKHIDTKHILLIHADGFVVNPNSWNDDFLDYDYIGAPWPLPNDDFSFRDVNGNIVRVGNSVSLRSHRLLSFPSKHNIPWEDTYGYFHEDGFICTKIKHLIEAEGMRFAPLEIAVKFSHEYPLPETTGIKPFVFHKWFGANKQYPKFGRYKTNTLKQIIKKLKSVSWQK